MPTADSTITLVSKKNALFFALLAVITLGTYANSIVNGFVWDDNQVVVDNPVNRDLGGITSLLTTPDVVYADEPTPYYRPLNRLTYLVDFRMFGTNPIGYHCENVALHVLNVMLVYLVGLIVFSDAAPSFAAALIFAIHPVNAESVNFISARNNLLAAFFVLLSFAVFSTARRTNKPVYDYLSAALFLGGLLSKESALMLFAVLAGMVLLFDRQDRPVPVLTRVRPLVPFFVVALLYLFVRRLALLHAGTAELHLAGLGPRLLQNISIIPNYLGMLVFPANLKIFYVIPADFLAKPGIWAAWAVIIVAAILFGKIKSPASRIGLLWLACNYLPISNLVEIPSAPMADRYLYLPMVGICFIAADAWALAMRRAAVRKAVLVAGIAAALALAAVTVQRNGTWHDDYTLFSTLVRDDPESAFGHYNLGNIYKLRGDLVSAQREWEKTLAILPTHAQAMNQLGNIHFLQNDFIAAEEYYASAVRMNPAYAEAHYNLAMTLERLHKQEQALVHYRAFLAKVPPEYADVAPAVADRVKILEDSGRLSR